MVVISRRLRAAVIAGVALGCLYSAATHAQKSPQGNQDNGGLNGSLSRSDLEKLGGAHGASGASLTPEKATEQSAKLLAALQLSCEISAAQLVVSGSRRIDGKETPVRVFEVACTQGLGYLLETQGSATPVASSCLTTEEARAGDVAKGKEPGFFCKLPQNRDVNAAVAALIASGTGTQCTVRRLQWLGRSDSAHSEYSEVVCEGGKGYVLSTALPGSQAKPTVTRTADQRRPRCPWTPSKKPWGNTCPVRSSRFAWWDRKSTSSVMSSSITARINLPRASPSCHCPGIRIPTSRSTAPPERCAGSPVSARRALEAIAGPAR
jgi:hypothetical protein